MISSTTHQERHFTASETVRDIVIGMADGLTVPFALAAGLTGAIAQSKLVVTAGFAEIAAGSIAMGLGGYLAGKSACEHYDSERAREEREVVEKPEAEVREVEEVFAAYGLTQEQTRPVIEAFKRDPKAWVDFMMRFELGLEQPDPSRALKSALTIAGAYVAGGLIPLTPYLLIREAHTALFVSAAVTLVALFSFGMVKGHFSGTPAFRSGVQTLVIGGLAAGAAFGIAKLIA
jgi:VIT1/CCC1 family predicted Fe2+/Mn2+ transporter